MLGNVSSLVPVKWYLGQLLPALFTSLSMVVTGILGIPFNDTNWRFQIAELGEAVLGDNLLGFQASNEPDLYQR